jgi:hypothetical protein
MTEQKKYEVPAPPWATNYKIELTASMSGDRIWDGGPTATGDLTCTTCGEVIHHLIDDWVLTADNRDEWIQNKVTRHNRAKHLNLIHVLTSEGWVQAGDLIKDPVKAINDMIDADAKSKGLLFK